MHVTELFYASSPHGKHRFVCGVRFERAHFEPKTPNIMRLDLHFEVFYFSMRVNEAFTQLINGKFYVLSIQVQNLLYIYTHNYM